MIPHAVWHSQTQNKHKQNQDQKQNKQKYARTPHKTQINILGSIFIYKNINNFITQEQVDGRGSQDRVCVEGRGMPPTGGSLSLHFHMFKPEATSLWRTHLRNNIPPKIWVEQENTVMNFHSNIIHNKPKCKQHTFHE